MNGTRMQADRVGTVTSGKPITATSLVPGSTGHGDRRPLALADGQGGPRTSRQKGATAQGMRDPALLAPAALTLAIVVWGITAPSYWRDEADTVSAVSRSLPQLIQMLGHVDAVHGTYYLLLWPVARVFGISELTTRLPSALAMSAAALGVSAIARRLGSRRAAWCAGLVFAVLPVVSEQGHDARPYAMVTAAAVLASYLLIRAAEDPRPRRFATYSASLALLGYLHLFALLLVLAHAVMLLGLAWRERRGNGEVPLFASGLVARWWLAAVAGAATLVTPLAILGWHQRAQIAWISAPGWGSFQILITSLAAGPLVSTVVLGLLAVLGGRRGDGVRIVWLAAPWLLLPPAALFVGSLFLPVYYFLYVVFCAPAVALLAGAGLAALGPRVRLGGLILIAALALPTQLSARVPGYGGSLLAADQILANAEQPHDAVVYPQSGIPPWYLAYPDGFGRLANIGMAESGAQAGRLYGVRVALPVLLHREAGQCRIWAVETGPGWVTPTLYIRPGFRLAHEWQPEHGAIRIWLFKGTRAGCRRSDVTRSE
jgi:mannosyltransferase